jgi:alpha-mannosidase
MHQGWSLNTPLDCVPTSAHEGKLPSSGTFMQVSGKGITLTAFKQSEDAKRLIVRFYNASSVATQAQVKFSLPFRVTEVRLADMKETPGARVHLDGQNVRVPVGPWACVTLSVTTDSTH